MDIVEVPDRESFDAAGTDLVARWLAEDPATTLMPALGETPLGIYAGLSQRHAAGQLDTSRLRIVQLDAYLGIRPEDPRSLGAWLTRAVVEPLGIPEERVIRLPGDSPDPAATCRAYDAAVSLAGGIGVAILGLGPNGHLGFNEPPSGPRAPTRVVTLSPACLVSNARYWNGAPVPPRALTAGMPILLAARRILLVVAGPDKRAILDRVLHGPPNDDVPGSWLRLAERVTVLADAEALGTHAGVTAGR